MTSCVRVLSTHTLDSFPSILLVAPNGKKTLVNCGEGCQRIFLEFGQKVATIDRVCLTHLGHETIGGLPGMILTASDVLKQATDHAKQAAAVKVANTTKQQPKQPKKRDNENNNIGSSRMQPGLRLLGPDGTYRFFRSLRHFMRRDSFWVDIQEGAYVQGGSNGNAATKASNAKKKNKKKDSNSEDFLVQSIVAYSGSDPDTNADTSTNVVTQSNLECVLENSVFPSKKRPRITDRIESTTTTSTVSDEKALHKPSPNYHTPRQILSFLFTTPPIQGKFMIEKAKALGVPKGPLYGKLKSGKSVTFPSPSDSGGESTTVTVESHQVVEPGSPGAVVATLCYPSFFVLDQLRTSKDLKQFERQTQETSTANANISSNTNQKDKKYDDKKTNMELVIHMTTKDIFESDTCATWRKSFFQESVRHMFLRTETTTTTSMDHEVARGSPSVFQSGHSGASLRSRVCSDVFRAPIPEAIASEKTANNTIPSEEQELPGVGNNKARDDELSSVVNAVPLLEYVLLPRSRRGFCNHDFFYQKWKTLEDEARLLLDKSGCIDRANQILKENNVLPETTMGTDATSHSITSIGGEILFTGTGSAVPCKHRNVSGIHVRMDNGNAMLLDVGEGTIGQLLRAKQHQKYRGKGEESLADVLKKIKAVWISHPHADHHLGIIRLLEERQRLVSNRDPLVLIAPPNILGFLQEYESVDSQVASSYVFLDCRALKADNGSNMNAEINPNSVALQRLHKDLGIHSCTAIPVAHCAHSFAVVFHGTSFASLAYSGDCRPSKNFSKIAYDADVLIHEATFADGMEADAMVKRHCTVGEALHVAKEMNAKTIILTHFSQRYPKIPVLGDTDDKQANNTLPTSAVIDSSPPSPHDMKIIHAFDFMTITPSNIPVASKLTPAVQLLYPDESEDTKENKATEMSDARAALEIPGFFAQSDML
mmetsp:Transcript_19884/g.41926  ORF Transcript_19884/g.41926 Transcript_19884/m.41926 type:complete len:939 (+) Transcript_19884:151-2967(+)